MWEELLSSEKTEMFLCPYQTGEYREGGLLKYFLVTQTGELNEGLRRGTEMLFPLLHSSSASAYLSILLFKEISYTCY